MTFSLAFSLVFKNVSFSLVSITVTYSLIYITVSFSLLSMILEFSLVYMTLTFSLLSKPIFVVLLNVSAPSMSVFVVVLFNVARGETGKKRMNLRIYCFVHVCVCK